MVADKSENYFVNIENIPCAFLEFIYDEKFTFCCANTTFYKLIKYTNDDFKRNNSVKKILSDKSIEFIEKEIVNASSDYFSVHIKVIDKDNNSINVLLQAQINYKNNNTVFTCTLVDIEAYIHKIKEVQMEKEIFSIAADISCEIVFEVDFTNDAAIFSKDIKTGLIRNKRINNFSKFLMNNSIIHEDDKIYLSEYYDCAKEGISGSDIEFRVKNIETSKFEWFSLSYISNLDENGLPFRAIGIFKNIDSQKKERKQLIEKSQIDGLTKLYNKTMTETEIKKYLEYGSAVGEKSALILIDVDSFKSINDNYGHLLGDAALVDIAATIKKVFRETDIVGRVGGDEFVVFMKSIPNNDIVFNKVNKLCSEIREIYTEEIFENVITVSVGIAVTPSERISYKRLFKNADIALYDAKRLGKNGFSIYVPENKENFYNNTVNFNYNVKKVKSIKSLCTTIFNTIKKSSSVEQTVLEILSDIGEKINASRTFFIEYDTKKKVVIRDFTWSSNEKYNFYYDIEFIGNENIRTQYVNCFSDNNVFYCSDTSRLNENLYEYFSLFNVKATLQCASSRDDNILGIIGIYDCEQKRLWLQDEVSTLSFLVNIISDFTSKTIN